MRLGGKRNHETDRGRFMCLTVHTPIHSTDTQNSLHFIECIHAVFVYLLVELRQFRLES
jgi:hypothetical protein